VTIVVSDGNNPANGANGEIFAVTEAFAPVGAVSQNSTSGTLTTTFGSLGGATINGEVFVAFGVDVSLPGNTTAFSLQSFSITSGSTTFYELDPNDVIEFNEIADDPFTTIADDDVEFNGGGGDIDASIFIPLNSFNGLTLDSMVNINYDFSIPGNNPNFNFLGVTDGTIVIPEPSTVCLLLLSFSTLLTRRARR